MTIIWCQPVPARKPKVRFPTEHAARCELIHIATVKAAGRTNRKERNCYYCSACGGWHLTSW